MSIRCLEDFLLTQFETLIQECEEAIRTGRIAIAARKLTSLTYSSIPRNYRAPLAKLCRRAGLFTSALKILTPIVHSKSKGLREKPTPEELAEYGACLQINGSIGEAIQILKHVRVDVVPESLLYRGWCHFTRWEYAEALPYLETYVQASVGEYWKLVGAVNLAAALAMLKKHDESLETLNPALEESSKGGMGRIQANCLELRAQVYIQKGEDSKAESDLNEALRILDLAKVQETLFIKKYQAILEAKKTRSVQPFLKLKDEARKLSRWELLREADLFALKINFNSPQFEHLVYGTPYPAYQARVTSELNVRALGSHATLGDKDAPCFHIDTGDIDGQFLMEPGCKTHQAVEALLRDFYRPSGVGGLFSILFPDEAFDIFSSPGRIHQIVRRTRKWLIDAKLPLVLNEEDGHYRIESTSPFSFRVPLVKQKVDWGDIMIGRLGGVIQFEKNLSASRIREHLQLTQDEYRRFIKWAIDNNRCERIYDGSLPLYVFNGVKVAA